MLIRQASIVDKARIHEFLKLAYPGRSEFKFPHRWEWAFENNPFLEGAAPPVWIALSPDGRVIGQSAALVEPLVVGGRVCRAGWGVDFHVLSEYRGQGIGSALQAANNEAQEVFLSLSMAEAAAQIKTSLGLLPLPEVAVFHRILHHDPVSVAETLGQRFALLPSGLRRLAAGPLARILTRRGALAPAAPTAGLEIRREPVFNEAFDRLWEQVSPAYDALVRRDAVYLNWKFRDQPHMRHETWGCYRDGRLSGYAILRQARPPERNAGILVDLFAHPEDRLTAGALISLAVRRFFELRVTYVSAASSVPGFQAELETQGFHRDRAVTPLARAPFPLPDSGWLLGKGDHDWDQYPLA